MLFTLWSIFIAFTANNCHGCNFDIGQDVLIFGLNNTKSVIYQKMNNNFGTILCNKYQNTSNVSIVQLTKFPFTKAAIPHSNLKEIQFNSIPDDVKSNIARYLGVNTQSSTAFKLTNKQNNQIMHDAELNEINMQFKQLIAESSISALTISKQFTYDNETILIIPSFMGDPINEIQITFPEIFKSKSCDIDMVRGSWKWNGMEWKSNQTMMNYLAFKVRDMKERNHKLKLLIVTFENGNFSKIYFGDPNDVSIPQISTQMTAQNVEKIFTGQSIEIGDGNDEKTLIMKLGGKWFLSKSITQHFDGWLFFNVALALVVHRQVDRFFALQIFIYFASILYWNHRLMF